MSRQGPLLLDPMRARATDNGYVDAFHGARGIYVYRERARARARAAGRLQAELDIGEPGRAWVAFAFLLVTLLTTMWEFVTYGASPTTSELARAGGNGIGSVATGNWWKLVTANLLHANLAHVALNAFVIVLVGRWLEHLVGRLVVVATVLWSMLLASVGALVVDVPHVSIGASGVAFGLVGCAVAADPRARTATGVIARQFAVINVIATFLVPGISIGGHLGGLAAGLLVGALCFTRRATAERPAGRGRRVPATVAILLALPPLALLLAGPEAVPGEARELRGRLVAPLLDRQLAGSTLTSGTKIEDASCRPAAPSTPTRFVCRVDDRIGALEFSERDDQWSIAIPE